ncbi:TetR/AcrR family transcriptional regulator [Mycetocola lacteus]|uniref:TetR/AcrR family transcriptional regulator n=1 Tax=Mycetocola lacteus TaxID=76637 RepID=A0A3L7AS33_9MICO|nr:TetR family transcriptional regulator [Mycetocola lacteus]RLP82238.1 TetR/AcrR family transcriptional regulator [Mycetocola lacteus]
MTSDRLPQSDSTATAGEITGMRRAPRQERSEKRVTLILDTFAQLIDEVGYSAISLSLLARRVGMSGPGIYRYFDGLPAVARALATRNQERVFEAIVARISHRPEADWDEAVTDVIAGYADFFRTEPGFRWLRLGNIIDEHQDDAAETNRMIAARRVGELFANHFNVVPRPDFGRHIEVVVEVTDSLVARAFELSPEGDEFFLTESARMVVTYVGDYLERTRPAGSPGTPPKTPKG